MGLSGIRFKNRRRNAALNYPSILQRGINYRTGNSYQQKKSILRITKSSTAPRITILSQVVSYTAKSFSETATDTGGLVGNYLLDTIKLDSELVKYGHIKVGKIPLNCSLYLATLIDGCDLG